MNQRRFLETFPITSLLLVLNVGMFVVEILATRRFDVDGSWSLFANADGRVLTTMGALSPRSFVEGGYWRAISAMFLHGNLLHLGMNSLVLWNIGPFCEARFSSPKYLTIFVLTGLGGAAGTLIYRWLTLSMPFRWIPYSSVGASGAISGLVGVLLVYSIRTRQEALRAVLTRAVIVMVVFSLIVGSGRVVGFGIDHGAHIGGFLAGCLLGLTIGSTTTSASARRWKIPAYCCFALVALCLAVSIYQYVQLTRVL